MFYASSRRTESNPRTIAAIRAQRLREQERQRSAPTKRQALTTTKQLNVAKPIPAMPMPAAKPLILPDFGIADKVNRKCQQFLQAISKNAPAPVAKVYRPDFQKILLRICRVFRIVPHDITSQSRRADLILPRQAIYYWACRLTVLAYQAIGDRVGKRDHSTVIYGVDAYRKKRAKMGRNLREARRRS